MVTDMQHTTDHLHDQALDYLREGQEVIVKAVQMWAETWADIVHQFTSGDSSEHWHLNPSTMVDQMFDFSDRLLATQRRFAHNVIKAASPAWRAVEDPLPHTTPKI
jgi:hypothetical protein